MSKKMINHLGLVSIGALAMSPLAQAADVSISGTVEVETYMAEDYAGAKETETVLATVELGVDAKVNKNVDAHMLFLYEEGESDGPIMDEGTLTFKLNSGASITAGKMYVPFGSFETGMVSDPLTLELAETSESAIMYTFESGAASVSVYAFNGDIDKVTSTDNTDLGYGLNMGFGQENVYSVNLGYISNIADSDSIQGINVTPDTVDSFVAGAALSISMNMGNMTVNLEHVTALDSFAAGDLGGLAGTAQPSASMVDVSFDMGRGASFALGYQMTAEALFLGLPETAVGAAFSYEVGDGASLSFEYVVADDYSVADGGTGESASQFLIQMAAEF